MAKAPKKTASTTKSAQKTAPHIRVKSIREVIDTIQRHVAYNLHGRYSMSFSKTTQQKLVAYGPWLAVVVIVFIIPQLMALAKTGGLMSLSGFFNTIFFNQESWVILLVIFVNILLLVDGVGKLFEKSITGWTRMYQASLITAGYLLWQLFGNLSQPAAPILSLVGVVLILFTLLDIKSYYN